MHDAPQRDKRRGRLRRIVHHQGYGRSPDNEAWTFPQRRVPQVVTANIAYLAYLQAVADRWGLRCPLDALAVRFTYALELNEREDLMKRIILAALITCLTVGTAAAVNKDQILSPWRMVNLRGDVQHAR